eukprot:gene12877-15734_t
MAQSYLLAGATAGMHVRVASPEDYAPDAAVVADADAIAVQTGGSITLYTDPNEAVAYFQKTASENPDRIDLKRGLARSHVRAGQAAQAVTVWGEVVAHPEGTFDDRVALADALIRSNNWDRAAAELNKIPPTHETYERYRLEAMVADSKKQWKKADSFYEIAAGLTTKPAGVLNNWGFSKLSRKEFGAAEKLFTQALTYDPALFT